MTSEFVIIYEVNLHVDREIAEEFSSWLEGHIVIVVERGGFVDATWWECVETIDPDRVHWSIHYHATTVAALDAYLRDHAPRLREDGRKRFGKHFEADRRILRRWERGDERTS
jgi:hypothetical protein